MKAKHDFLLVALAYFVACMAMSEPAKAARLLHMDSADRIPGVYTVVFKSKTDLAALPAEALASIPTAPQILPLTELDTRNIASLLAQAANSTLTGIFFGDALTGFALEGVKDGIPAALLSDPRIDFIEPAVWVHPTGSPQTSPPWDLDRIDQRNLPTNGLYSYTTTAPDVDVYVLDTGVMEFHNEFTVACSGSIACTRVNSDTYVYGVFNPSAYVYCGNTNHNCGRVGLVLSTVYPMGGPDDPGDVCGHGTAMAGLIGGLNYGVAKGVRLRPIRIQTDCTDNGFNSQDIVAAINYSLASLLRTTSGSLAYPTVFNMSFASNSINTAIDNAVNSAVQAGVVVVVGAGNDNQNACTYSPAHLSQTTSVITAGASQSDDTAWWVSTMGGGTNWGNCVTLFAPGSNVVSAGIASLSDSRTSSGTSDATAIVSGIAALYLETHYGASPADVKSALVQAATPNKLSGNGFGPGSPNLLAYSLLPVGSQQAPPPGTVKTKGILASIISVLTSLFQ
jgi:hypothetical protein